MRSITRENGREEYHCGIKEAFKETGYTISKIYRVGDYRWFTITGNGSCAVLRQEIVTGKCSLESSTFGMEFDSTIVDCSAYYPSSGMHIVSNGCNIIGWIEQCYNSKSQTLYEKTQGYEWRRGGKYALS